jgi:hypothetical protein
MKWNSLKVSIVIQKVIKLSKLKRPYHILCLFLPKVVIPSPLIVAMEAMVLKVEGSGRCCAEEECVCVDGEFEGYTCHNCDKQVHSFCIQPIGDDSQGGQRLFCFKCVLITPSAMQMLDN